MEKDSSIANDQKDLEVGSGFDLLNESFVENIKMGTVWDVYIVRTRLSQYLPTWWKIEEYARIREDVPYLWRTLRDMSTVAGPLLLLYLVITLAKSLLPALSLWFSGQILGIVQSAIDNRAVDAHVLFRVAGGRALCTAADHVLYYALAEVSASLEARSRLFYSGRIFRSIARLDAPTWDNPAVSSHISALFTKFNDSDAVAWTAIMTLTETGSAFLRMLSEAAVLFGVLQGQGDGSLLVLVSLASDAVSFFAFKGGFSLAWAATTRDGDYIKMEGLNRVVSDTRHRKELVAGGLDEFLIEEYCSLANKLRGRAKDFWSTYSSSRRIETFEPIRLLRIPIQELPQIIFTLQVVQKPSSIPVSLASLPLLQQSSSTFMMRINEILQDVESISTRLSSLRNLYEAENIANKVVDGTIPFPENAQSIGDGISLEFRNVSFRYPGSEKYALRGVSFRVLAGQLCVIVGSNGSGKSTILKLAARIFDPMEGSILIDGHDIKTLRLADIRHAMAILFQDYTLFPLSIRDNIAMGNPRRARDNAAIEEAARLGGASELIAQLPGGLDAYLARPVSDIYSGSPDGTGALLSQKFIGDTTNQELSGGQMQRLAVARTFMRSSTMEQEVGLLMFDEPSASLDPTAEHDLFSRLRKLRGNKTMIFSTHRFGNLARHADLILYMDDSAIVEIGTHEELLKHEGSDYGRLWRMQAEAFL
ncbi:HlyB/MsbA family ABC transporter [Lactarius akahatsu]|uniref:HlyB/MsbA family ABC transporter n=1 Tax=Lactarius akahatsu TaxID=416441 RepID=A0AAD4QD77_9AGAM|nr:HlyB/MsbA family ABC transporter [Lactarius akahatsu]